MILALIGPPGSGKGTYSREIAKKYGILHIEAGKLLRDEMAKGSEIGKEITPYMNAGLIPPIEITIRLVRKKMEEGKNGAVFDGYPRNMGQAIAMEEFAKPDMVINLVLPDEILAEKILSRMSCPRCGEIYNFSDINEVINGIRYCLPSILPKKDKLCDKCGSELVKRTDQTPEIIKTRLNVHKEESEPLLEFYEKKGILINFDVTSDKDKTLEQLFGVIENKISEKGIRE